MIVGHKFPDTNLLVASDEVISNPIVIATDKRVQLIEKTLHGLGYDCKVIAATVGRAVTSYEIEIPYGVSVGQIMQCSDRLKQAFDSHLNFRIDLVPDKHGVYIEIPNDHINTVRLREVIESDEFQSSLSPLPLAMGKDIFGANVVCALEKMPHLLIAGAVGSGKSSCLHSIITSILYKSSPEDVRLVLIDAKSVEFNAYKGLPHLLGGDIIREPFQAVNAFGWLQAEMERRYFLLKDNAVRSIVEFNGSEAVKAGEQPKLPYVVVIVNELSELMNDDRQRDVIVGNMIRLLQKARAAGIHMILSTGCPSVDVLPAIIKANLPSRIAFAVKSALESRVILDVNGAETLLGKGDMLYAPVSLEYPKRVQGVLVTEQEVEAVTEYVRENNVAKSDDAFKKAVFESEKKSGLESVTNSAESYDELLPRVLKKAIELGTVSVSMVQRKFNVGYVRAARIIEQLEMKKFIGPIEDGFKPRKIYITLEQYVEIFGNDV